MMRLLFIAALAAACMSSANAAEDLTITDAEPLVRPGVLWRCTVRGSVDPGPGAGPLVLTVSLVAGSLVLAGARAAVGWRVLVSSAHQWTRRSGGTCGMCRPLVSQKPRRFSGESASGMRVSISVSSGSVGLTAAKVA